MLTPGVAASGIVMNAFFGDVVNALPLDPGSKRNARLQGYLAHEKCTP